MPLTKKWIVAFFAFASTYGAASAQSNADCLKHLGGGYGDTLCYGQLSSDLVKKNKEIYTTLRAGIPKGNPHATLLHAYMVAQDKALKFCELQRDAGAGWGKSPDGSMYPALYAGCVYQVRKSQNSFLSDLLKMSQW
ncbi:hypothetical protein SAMN05443245_6854 [Paraburkholderia fungorum]|uniref:DUF1311 domain-containing protein n=1 Tax=Paraburkholderia fungorum TaxID=134537 RepID=A0A1H1JME4_9BURK|nr:hypothetical protein [Paraburkholderia fungorum]SDR51178.1 hypothetical protein SAMN05443245_6854 [Paraburkholderia fungorum]